jgi:type IV pilus assembly protein PilQ
LQLGASWETGRTPGTAGRSARDFTGLADSLGQNFTRDFVGLGLQESFTDVLNRQNLSVTLTALEQSGESQTLSAPRLTVVNNLPATISDGKVQHYYEEYTVSQTITERAATSAIVPKGKPVSLTSGASLDVLASIGGDGRSILLALRPKVNQDVQFPVFASVTDPSGNSFEIRLPEFRTQDLSTRVIVQSGQTVVMGGVLEREQLTFVESVPILGNIPVLGAAFRKRTEVDKPRYLLIFVTATLLSESGEFLLVEDDL